MKEIRIACSQLDIKPGYVEENLRRMAKITRAVADQGADLIVFPELATTDYYVPDFSPLAAPVPGVQSDFLSDIAAENRIYLAAGLLEQTAEGIYNTALLLSPEGKIAGKYRKTHLSVHTRNDTIAKETHVFLPGDGLPVFQSRLGAIGMMICKDGDFPEVPRTLAVNGAEIILWMTNRGGVDPEASKHYAKTNQAILLTANRAEGYVSGGGSVIVDFTGRVVARADQGETVVFASIDTDVMRSEREVHWKQTRRRRPELYKALGEDRCPV